MASTHYTYEEVSAALNRAADDVLDVTNAGDEGLRDAINLVVNAAGSYLKGEAGSLAEVAEKNYDEAALEDILGWIGHG